MSEGFPRLLGDIGGTHARWAWQAQPGAALEDVVVVADTRAESMYASAAAYLKRGGHAQPKWAGIGIATAVTGDDVRMTNHPWSFSISELKRSLGLERCLVINDFTALAMSLPALGPEDLRAVGAGTPVADATIGLLGPGTGLGVSGLMPGGPSRWWPLSGEGGHVTLAATNDREAALLSWLRSRLGHVSAERVLSGSGLVNLYQAICALDGATPGAVEPADVTAAALSQADAQCVAAVAQFTAFLGNVAGNLALTLGARGGVYLGGGIVPRLGTAFDGALFRQQFEAKGRFADYLAAIPTWIIVAAAPALLGASRALDLMPAAAGSGNA
jgi:glucokinase